MGLSYWCRRKPPVVQSPCWASGAVQHCSECARHILLPAPLPAYEQATKPMIDTPTKKLPSAYYCPSWTDPPFGAPAGTLCSGIPQVQTTASAPNVSFVPNYRLISSIDPVRPRTQWRRGCGRALLIVDDAHHPTITLSTGPPDGIRLLCLPDPLYMRKPMLLNPSRTGLEVCGETRGA